MLTFDGVSLCRDGLDVIRNVSFKLDEGDFAAVIGANGAGKTTLSKLSNGLLKPTAGIVTVKGLDTRQAKTSQIARFTGFLFQNPDRQICQNTIHAEIAFGLGFVMENRDDVERRTQETLERFGFDGGKDPFTLSRGERQMLVLASLLAARPRFLILDEPTTGLDYRECMKVMGLIAESNAQGATVLMVTHDMEIVQDFAERALVINDGILLADAPVSAVMKNREVLERASLLPAQIPALAMRLGGDFADVRTVDEMSAKIEMKAREGVCAVS